MPQRLTESYRIADPVEIYLADENGESWQPGKVMALQHPGVWVMTLDDRQLWFVTNGRRIRRRDDTDAAAG